jgi:hypothetical protein
MMNIYDIIKIQKIKYRKNNSNSFYNKICLNLYILMEVFRHNISETSNNFNY